MNDEDDHTDHTDRTAMIKASIREGRTIDIVTAYLSNNAVLRQHIPALIADVHAALVGLGNPEISAKPAERSEPAVPIKKSVTPDAIFCLECGKPNKSMKRHLMTAHGLTPDEYRARWGLPATYPMAAPNYSAKRAALAKASGLGRKAG